MEMRKLYENKRTLLLSLPRTLVRQVGAERGDWFNVTVKEGTLVLRPLKGTHRQMDMEAVDNGQGS